MSGGGGRSYSPPIPETDMSGLIADLAAKADISTTRPKLTANRTFYVRTDGNDGNDGSQDDAGHAFKTVNHALSIATGFDFDSYDVTIQLHAGAYADQVHFAGGWIGRGGSSLTIAGDPAAIGGISITATNAVWMQDNAGKVLQLSNLKIDSPLGFGIIASDGGFIDILDNVEIGACAGAQLYAAFMSSIKANGNFKVSGSALYGVLAEQMSFICLSGRTITYSNNPAFGTSNFMADRKSCISCDGMTFTNGGTVTGQRFNVVQNSLIDTGGGGINYIPGNVPGVQATGGQYT